MQLRKFRFIVLGSIILLITTWFLYKDSKNLDSTSKNFVINNYTSEISVSSQEDSVSTSYWKVQQSKLKTGVSNLSGNSLYPKHYLTFEVTSRIPNDWAIGDNSYLYSNDQTTWVWKEGPHIKKPGLVPSQSVRIMSVAISNNPDIYSFYDKDLIRISSNGISAVVKRTSRAPIESEIIKSLKIKLISSQCLDSDASLNYYDCPAPTNVPFVIN